MRFAAIALILFACCAIFVSGCAHSSKTADSSATTLDAGASECSGAAKSECSAAATECSAAAKSECTAEKKACCAGAVAPE